MTFRRRELCFAAFGVLAACPARAEPLYPTRPVRIVVPSSPGGGTDIVGRVLAEHLTPALGQPAVVENRPGAGQMIGIETVARASPDGYTLLVAASTLILNGLLFRNVRYNAEQDFSPITQIAILPNVFLVHPTVPARTVGEFIQFVRAHPGTLSYASAGQGTSPHMSMELLKSLAGLKIEHIAYRGTAPAVTDLLAGRVSAMMVNVITARSMIDAGMLRPLGVTSRHRAVSLPDVPTIAEAAIPEYDAPQWYGLLAPAGTPVPIVDRLNYEARKAIASAQMGEKLAADGAEPVGNTPEEFASEIRADLTRWTRVVRDAGISPD